MNKKSLLLVLCLGAFYAPDTKPMVESIRAYFYYWHCSLCGRSIHPDAPVCIRNCGHHFHRECFTPNAPVCTGCQQDEASRKAWDDYFYQITVEADRRRAEQERREARTAQQEEQDHLYAERLAREENAREQARERAERQKQYRTAQQIEQDRLYAERLAANERAEEARQQRFTQERERREAVKAQQEEQDRLYAERLQRQEYEHQHHSPVRPSAPAAVFAPNTSAEQDIEECSICIEPITLIYTTLPCGHKFHTDCIKNWGNGNRPHPTCPLCRRVFNPDNPTIPVRNAH